MGYPVMIISAKVELNDKILGLDLGADDYITKPFDPLFFYYSASGIHGSSIRKFLPRPIGS